MVTVDGTTGAVLLVASRPDMRAWVQAAASLFRVLGTVTAVAVGGGAEAILFGYACAGAASSLLLAWTAWRVAWHRWTRAPRGPLPVRAVSARSFRHSVERHDKRGRRGRVPVSAILGNLAGHGAVGVFRAAMLPVLASSMLSQPLRSMLFPEQARLHAEGKLAELRQATRGYTLIALAFALPAAVIGWFALPSLIDLLFSSAFEGAVGAARILLIAAVVQFTLSWSKSFHAAVGRPHIRTLLASVSLGLSLLLLLLLGERGADGAAIAYTVATVSTAGLWLIIVHRYLASEEARVEGLPSRGRDRRGTRARDGRSPSSRTRAPDARKRQVMDHASRSCCTPTAAPSRARGPSR